MSDVHENVNDRFFSGSYQHVWKNLISPALTLAECDLIMDCCRLSDSSSVLDLMCGYGRHAIELANRGAVVDAVDNLLAYTSEVREEAVKKSLPITVTQSTVQNLDWSQFGLFDGVISMGNSFSFLNRTETIDLLGNISSHLKPGGGLMINSWMITEIAVRHFKEKEWYYAGEFKCLLDYEYLLSPARIKSEQTIISPEGCVEVIQGVDYLYTLNELSDFFHQSGLGFKAAYSTPRKKPFSMGDSQIYIYAVKV